MTKAASMPWPSKEPDEKGFHAVIAEVVMPPLRFIGSSFARFIGSRFAFFKKGEVRSVSLREAGITSDGNETLITGQINQVINEPQHNKTGNCA